MPEARRFPPPWSVEETDACFIVRDHNGQALAYVYFEEERDAAQRSSCSRATRLGASPPTSPSCRSCCGPADKRGVTRLQPHISRQSAQCRLRPQVRKYRRNAISVVMGHVRHFAPQKSSEPFRRRTTVKSVIDLPIRP
jgi:hypothetical protein